jgi:hypothetical protein
MDPGGGHSLHILASTSNEKIFFDILRNTEKKFIYLHYIIDTQFA